MILRLLFRLLLWASNVFNAVFFTNILLSKFNVAFFTVEINNFAVKNVIMRINAEHTAALIIDVQERLLPAMSENGQLLANTIKLLKGLQILEIPSVFTQQYTRGLGDTVAEVKGLYSDFEFTEKTTFSCCGEPAVDVKLNQLGKNTVIVAGIESHVCVLQTVTDLVDLGFEVVVAVDCIASRHPFDKKYALKRMMKEGATLSTTESILFELLGKAGGDKFKAISALVK